MNILFILPQIEKGGGQSIQALNLAENLNKKNNNVYVLTFKSKVSKRELPRSWSKFPKFSFNIILNYTTVLIAPFLVGKVKKLIVEWKIDIIQSFDPHVTNFLAICLGKSLNIPVFCRIGGKYREFYEDKLIKGNFLQKFLYYIKIPSLLLMIIEYYTIKNIKALISNCSYLLNSLKQSFLMRNLNFNWTVIPNGVDLDRFSLNEERILDHLEDDRKRNILLYVGRIEDYKGIDTLIQAVDIVRKRIPDVYLLLVGNHHYNESYYTNLRKRITQLKLSQHINFVGEKPHSEIPSYLKIAKIVILPSYSAVRPIYEGCPNVVLEAMASERLVIASKVGGVPEIIQNNKTGLLFEPKQSFQLADLIISSLKNPERVQELVANGRKFIIENHAFEIIVKKYLELYNRSLSSH
jgi:glycosyltransferase involved in cell wall biosynthesis